jgi:hypothetical protein
VTFSHSDVVDIVSANFVPVWESVAPVRVAHFDLGKGKVLKGTVGGEIALYFCRPDGKVFDILPALHSPQVTFWAIENALDFYRLTQATDAAVWRYHRQIHEQMVQAGLGETNPQIERSKRDLKAREFAWDPATRDLGRMVRSKTGIFQGGEPVVVVEPGGLDYYRRRIRELLFQNPLHTPAEWKETIFVQVLEQELKGGIVEYDVNSLQPFAIMDE